MRGQKFLQNMRKRVRSVRLQLRRLDVINLRHFLRGHFAGDSRNARPDHGRLQCPSSLRGDRLPARNRLPGDAVQFPFPLFDDYQYVVRHKCFQFRFRIPRQRRGLASCCGRDRLIARSHSKHLAAVRRGKSRLYDKSDCLTAPAPHSSTSPPASSPLPPAALPETRYSSTSPANKASRFSADSRSDPPAPPPSSPCASACSWPA